MVNNIIWKERWEINSVESKNDHNTSLWLSLTGKDDAECKIRLLNGSEKITIKEFFGIKGMVKILALRVVPNKEFYLVLGEENDKTSKKEIQIVRKEKDLYTVCVTVTTEDVTRRNSYHKVLMSLEQLKNNMEGFEKYLELYDFLLPFGCCFE